MNVLSNNQCAIHVLSDNRCAIHLATNPAYHTKTKYIDVRYHFLRHVIDGRMVALKKVHILENCENILMKLVTIEKL